MTNDNVTPQAVQLGGYELSLGLLHGELETGKPVFLQLIVKQGGEEVTGFEPMGEASGRAVLTNNVLGLKEELGLEETRAGLMKKVEFPRPGTYQVKVQFKHQGKIQEADFTLHVEEGYVRDNPVG